MHNLHFIKVKPRLHRGTISFIIFDFSLSQFYIKFRHTNIDVARCGFGEYSIYLRLNCRFNSEAFRSGWGGGVGTNYAMGE